MLQDVPTADVVVTNPTHFAVALRYDEKKPRAHRGRQGHGPAGGEDPRDRHRKRRAPRRGAAAGARAVSSSVDIGREVPAALYVTVAQVLTYVYQLRAARDARRDSRRRRPTIH